MRIEFFPYPFLVGVVILAAWLTGRIRRRNGFWSVFCCGLFGLYILLLLGVTLFPLPYPDALAASLTWPRIASTLSHVNLVPAYYGTNLSPGFLFPEILQNILLTIPFGFGISFIVRLKTRNIFWLGTLVGFSIELAQLLLSIWVGGTYRSTDINDLLLNASGVWIGYALFSLFAWLVRRFVPGGRGGLAAFLREVSDQSRK